MKKKRTILKKLNGLIKKAKVPRYLHHFGPKKYTTWQHTKSILLKEKLKADWRSLAEDYLPYFFDDVPHFTTLQKFAKRIPILLWNTILSLSAAIDYCLYGAYDSTGFSRTSASSYYIKRIDREEPINSYIKLSFAFDIIRRKFLSARIRAKPVHDVKDIVYLVKHSPVTPEVNIMDKGYDANWIHNLFRDKGSYSIIPVRKWSKTRGSYRREMKLYFDYGLYWQRNLAETGISCVKRKYGSCLKARKIKTQIAEIYSRLILHNIFYFIIDFFYMACFNNKVNSIKKKIAPGRLSMRSIELFATSNCRQRISSKQNCFAKVRYP